ncbi:MAG: IclR family transcriptional regulator, partial [Rubrivivax sp.]
RNLKGQTVAALNVVVSPQKRELDEVAQDLLPLLQEAARELRPLL